MTIEEAIDQDIRDELARAMAQGPVLADDPVAAVRQRVSNRRARRQHRLLLGVIGVFVTLVFVTMSFLNATEPGDVRTANQQTTTTGALSPSPSTSMANPAGELPGPPLDVRSNAAVVWTGREVVVWGGDLEAANMGLPGSDRAYKDGAAFDPATGQWRKLSPSPLPTSRGATFGVRVGAGIVFVRGQDSALWDPDSDTWQSFDDAPGLVNDLSSTGRGAISYTGNALLDPVSGEWTELPDPPLRLERPTTAWDGDELVVVGGPSTPFTDAAAIAYDLDTQRWRTLPAPPSGLSATALSADFDGERIVVVNYDMTAAAYDPTTDSWTPLPDVPARFSEWHPTVRSIRGRSSVAFMAHAAVILRDGDRWLPLPYTDFIFGEAVATDQEGGPGAVYGLGFDPESRSNVLTSIVPDEAADSPDQIQVGLYTVDLPNGTIVDSATYSRSRPEPGESVRVELQTTAGICVLVAGSGTPQAPDTVSESLNGLDWTRDEAGHTWRAETSSTDALRIDCDNTDDARALATSVPPPFK